MRQQRDLTKIPGLRLLDAYPDLDDLPEPPKDSKGQLLMTVEQEKGQRDLENFRLLK